MGVVHSISAKSIHPIYIKLKNKLIKVNIFDGIKPPSIDDLPLITDLESHYQIGSRVQVFSRKGKLYWDSDGALSVRGSFPAHENNE